MTDTVPSPFPQAWVSELRGLALDDDQLRWWLYCAYELGRSRGVAEGLLEPETALDRNPFSIRSMREWAFETE